MHKKLYAMVHQMNYGFNLIYIRIDNQGPEEIRSEFIKSNENIAMNRISVAIMSNRQVLQYPQTGIPEWNKVEPANHTVEHHNRIVKQVMESDGHELRKRVVRNQGV